MHRCVKIGALVALVLTLARYAHVSGQELFTTQPEISAEQVHVNTAPRVLTPHTLKASYFDATPLGLVASCGSLNCSASTTMFNESVKCPALAGKKCTFQVAIASDVQVAGNSGAFYETGDFQFLIDGTAPNSGGTDQFGFYPWELNAPNSGALFGTSSGISGTVKNTVANQAHTIVVNLGCSDNGRDSQGCVAVANFPSLHIAVLTP